MSRNLLLTTFAFLLAFSGAVVDQPQLQGSTRPEANGGALDDVQLLQKFALQELGLIDTGREVGQTESLVVGDTEQEDAAENFSAAPSGARAVGENGAEGTELKLGLSGASRAVGQRTDSGSGGTQQESTVRLEVSRKTARRMALGLLTALMMVAMVPLLRARGVKPLVALLVYLVGTTMVKVCVKQIFDSGYPYPYATTAFQMAMTGLVASCIERPTVSGAQSSLNIAVVKCASLALSNVALVVSTPAVVSLVGALLPAATYGVELLRHRDDATTPRTLGVLAACVGAMLCVRGELSCAPSAVLLIMGACLCRSLKTVWSRDFMQDEGQSPFRLAAWTAAWCVVIMVPVMQVREGTDPLVALCSLSASTKIIFLVGGVLSAGTNILMCYLLKCLGPLRQNVYGQLELVLLFTFSVSGLHEYMGAVQWMGIMLISLSCVLIRPAASSSTKGLHRDRRLYNTF